MITQLGQEVTWGELHVGSRSVFAAAGFEEVSHPDTPAGRDAHRLLSRCHDRSRLSACARC